MRIVRRKIKSRWALPTARHYAIISDMKTKTLLFASAFAVVLSGCWTVSETEFPAVSTTAAPSGKSVIVKFANFRTGVYEYKAVEGHETMQGAADINDVKKEFQQNYVDSSMSWMLQNSASGSLVSRAMTELARQGYTVDPKKAKYQIEIAFKGPELPEHDVLRQCGYYLCTLFTAENTKVTWSAEMQVRNAATDELYLKKDYTQEYEIMTWGPLPLLSPCFSLKTSVTHANSWALTALTDIAIADATAFIANKEK